VGIAAEAEFGHLLVQSVLPSLMEVVHDKKHSRKLLVGVQDFPSVIDYHQPIPDSIVLGYS
jgi:hypothetical protein